MGRVIKVPDRPRDNARPFRLRNFDIDTPKVHATAFVIAILAVIAFSTVPALKNWHGKEQQNQNTSQPASASQNQSTQPTSNTSTPDNSQPQTVTIPQQTAPILNPPTSSGYSGPAYESDGFNAGYDYADQYQICDPNYDNGYSQDFNDGVLAWEADNCNQ